MLRAAESADPLLCEFCEEPAAEVSLVSDWRKAGIEKMLAEVSIGVRSAKETLEEASANDNDLLSFPATSLRWGEESEFLGFKALI
jgi:hypothetical protein